VGAPNITGPGVTYLFYPPLLMGLAESTKLLYAMPGCVPLA